MSEVFSSGPNGAARIFERLKSYLLGQGNWKSALAESGLPDDVQFLIKDVVQQTRLLRFEKTEIAADLIHHFHDGHERGHSYDELVRDFGATEVAVPLFRSSKLRSRPMSVKAFRGSMMAFGGGLISYLLLQLFFHSAKPNPKVDYVAKLNEAVAAIPEDQNAWPLYRDVWVKHGLVEGKIYEELWFEESSRDSPEVLWTDHKTHRRLIRPDDIGWDKACQKLDSLVELLDVLREGSSKPYVGVNMHSDLSKYSDEDLRALFPDMDRDQTELPQDPMDLSNLGVTISAEAGMLLNGSTWGILLPHIQQLRRAARVLRVDTRYAIQQRDNARAITNVEAILGLGKQAGESPFLVCAMVGAAIRSIGMSVVEELVTEHLEQLSDDDLLQLQSVVAKLDMKDIYDLTSEKDFSSDFIQRIYSDNGNGDGRMTAVGADVLFALSKMNGGPNSVSLAPWQENHYVRAFAGPTKLFTAPTRKEAEALIDTVYEELNRHIQTRMWEDHDFDPQEYLKEKDSGGLFSGIGVVSRNLKQSREVKIARQDAVLLALAMHRYQRSQNKWPTTLRQLEPDWLDRKPIDRISGNALSFTVRNNHPVIYSVGHDGDDDGGDAKNLPEAAWFDKDGDGDWVLWPTQEN